MGPSRPSTTSCDTATSGYLLALVLVLTLVLAACADTRTGGPDLLPLSPATVAVSETLRLPLTVDNPGGASLAFTFTGPDLPGLSEVTSLSGGVSGGEFRWTPLASHVGTHELTFTVSSSLGDDTESVLVSVTPGAGSAPIFLRPGAGGTYDLSRDPCVRFDIEVRDDDSPDVDLRFRAQPVAGAALVQTGARHAEFEWCPSLEQVDLSDRWTIELEAADADHDPTPHDYLVVLRTNARDNCQGQPPVVTVTTPAPSARVTSASGFRVTAQITDDVGVRDAPLLYYSSVKPDDVANPDVTEFSQTTFTLADTTWTAVIPPLGLAPAEERTIYYVVSVTDNDDPNGTACDHRTDTALSDFVAVGGDASERAPDCEVCSTSPGCESGICAASGGGSGICLPGCAAGDGCGSGACASRLTVEGGIVPACGGPVAYCEGGGGQCDDDEYEPNDALGSPRALTSAGPLSATYCDGDDDFYALVATQEAELTVVLDAFDSAAADLDLELLGAAGTRLDISGGLGDSESVTACVTGGETLVARVYSVVSGSQSNYALTFSELAGECCLNDLNEPDPLESPTPIAEHGNFDGTICPGDSDHHSFVIDGPTHLEALLIFEHDEADLDLELYGPTGTYLTGSYDVDDDEEIGLDLAVAGRYVLRVEVYDDGAADYLGQIVLDPLASCGSTDDCPVRTVCSGAGLCASDACTTAANCPAAHLCPVAGPDAAPRHCAATCVVNADCRDSGSLPEACKRFAEGPGCAVRGSGANGADCDDFSHCGGQRACAAWPGGYCARLACTSGSDCESNTFCASVLGQNVCVRRCGGAEPACRTAEGYTCATLAPVGGGALTAGCVPQ